MDCNKQEAIRAKDIAERKLLEKDFGGAKKIALKAQQLFPELENISQLLSVCEVHCAAAIKINGLEDWYGILQVEPTADELSIKKQYRKLALSLHPDKNKFAGAEAAFKLIGEAHRTLTDKEKRSNYDVRRKPLVKPVTQKKQVNQKFSAPVQPGVPMFFQNYGPQFNGAQNIWTKCPHCNVVYHLPRSLLNRALCCQQCRKTYVAYDVYMRPAPGTVPVFVPKHPGPGVSQQNFIPPQNAFKAANSSGTGFNAQDASKTAQGNFFGTNSSNTTAFPQGAFKATQGTQYAANSSAAGSNGDVGGGAAGSNGDVGGGAAVSKEKGGEPVKDINKEEQVNSVPTNQTEVKFGEVKFANVKKREPAAKSKNQKASRKMKKECSEDEFSDTGSSDSDVNIQETKTFVPNMDGASNLDRRRSTRQKRNVTYAEDQSDDDDFVSAPKKSRVDTSGYDANQNVNSGETKEELNADIKKKEPLKESSSGQHEDNFEEEPEVSSSSTSNTCSSESEPCILSYPDPEFHDFDRDRDAGMFRHGQIWATYDDVDGMPRFYAKIIEVICTFKVRFTWLETVPGNQAETDWSDAGLPVACGNFKLGATETTDNRSMFSHVIPWHRGKKRSPYIVKPGNGEVWAMYKNWDISWSSDVDGHESFEYEIVEIVSDGDSAINIVMLYKAENFVSVFTRDLDAAISSIPSSEMLRFSHMVPSYKIPVPEAESFCRVYYEIDPGALPSDFGDKFLSVKLGDQVEHALRQIKETCHKPAAGCVEDTASHCTPNKTTLESEWLHNFELEKSYAKLRVGQIWALYCDIDAFPKYYAYICDVDDADHKVSVRWLDYCDDLEEDSPWLSHALPVACGRFKFSTSKGSRESFCSLEKFSHLVRFESQRSHKFKIYPHTGEVWALYKNWSIEWDESDLKSCEYDILEVMSAGAFIRAAVLTKVNESSAAIFTRRTEEGSVVTVDITPAESLKFSHLVPSHRLTVGPWAGCWQLDPHCVPVSLLK